MAKSVDNKGRGNEQCLLWRGTFPAPHCWVMQNIRPLKNLRFFFSSVYLMSCDKHSSSNHCVIRTIYLWLSKFLVNDKNSKLRTRHWKTWFNCNQNYISNNTYHWWNISNVITTFKHERIIRICARQIRVYRISKIARWVSWNKNQYHVLSSTC